MFFKTYAEKQIESKGRDFDDAARRAKAQHKKDREEIERLKAELERALSRF